MTFPGTAEIPDPLPIELLLQRNDNDWDRNPFIDDEPESEARLFRIRDWIVQEVARLMLIQGAGADLDHRMLLDNVDVLYDTVRSATTRQDLLQLTFFALVPEATALVEEIMAQLSKATDRMADVQERRDQ